MNVQYFACRSTAMAGNIIPAIATTNAVIAGLIVMEALKILSGQIDQCKTVSWLLKFSLAKLKLWKLCQTWLSFM